MDDRANYSATIPCGAESAPPWRWCADFSYEVYSVFCGPGCVTQDKEMTEPLQNYVLAMRDPEGTAGGGKTGSVPAGEVLLKSG